MTARVAIRASCSVVAGIIVLLATTAVAGAHAGDPGDYRWVDPPEEFADDNTAPERRSVPLLIGPGPTAIWTSALQIHVSFAPGSLEAFGSVDAVLDHLAPGALASPPPDTDSVGNVAVIEFLTDGAPLPPLSDTVVLLAAPHEFDGVAHSDDEGRTWTMQDAVSRPEGGYATPFTGNGWYVGVVAHGGSGSTPLAVILGLPAVALVLLVLGRRARGAPASTKPGPATV